MKKKVLVILIFIGSIFILKETIAICICNFIDHKVIKKNKNFVEQQVTIPKGKSAKEITKILEDRKVIFSKIRFIILAKVLGVEDKLKAGEYKFNSKMTTLQIIEKLQKGEVILHKFTTIPEGYNLREIANLLAEKKLVDKDKFLKYCYEVSILKEREQKVCQSLEGYLFPDTYEMSGLKEEDIVKMMVNRFYEITGYDYEALARRVGLDFHEAVIMASLIEKEAKVPEEREIISAVFHNRLKRRMPLSSCATVMYSLGRHKKKLSYRDLKINSPYNTYLRVGFPPGPICNPGKEALWAAVNPAPTNYLYFVSLGNGRHKFSKDYNQHIEGRN